MKGRKLLFVAIGALVAGCAALAWKEYPALVRYMKIERM